MAEAKTPTKKVGNRVKRCHSQNVLAPVDLNQQFRYILPKQQLVDDQRPRKRFLPEFYSKTPQADHVVNKVGTRNVKVTKRVLVSDRNLIRNKFIK